jgi:hypothetical protein
MSAIFSPCGLYRYCLTRDLHELTRYDFMEEVQHPPRVRLYVMLNPSYAGEDRNDPTARRTIGFGLRDGFSRIMLGNAFGIVETDSAKLKSHADPVGPDNDHHLAEMAGWADEIVVAWGARSKFPRGWAHREREVLDLLRGIKPVFCLGTTGDGSPAHPLFLPKNVPVRPYLP